MTSTDTRTGPGRTPPPPSPDGASRDRSGSRVADADRVTSSVTTAPLDPAAALDAVGRDADGAVLLFLGTVRDHADGRPVCGMRYDAYQAMAADVLDDIAWETAEETGVGRIHVSHRTGELEIGEVSVAIAVSSPHREEAYRASRRIIEEIKRRLPVWKKEFYTDGDAGWVEGVDPRSGAGLVGDDEGGP